MAKQKNTQNSSDDGSVAHLQNAGNGVIDSDGKHSRMRVYKCHIFMNGRSE